MKVGSAVLVGMGVNVGVAGIVGVRVGTVVGVAVRVGGTGVGVLVAREFRTLAALLATIT